MTEKEMYEEMIAIRDDKIERLKSALEYFALQGHGSDCTPTVLNGNPEYLWWCDYLNDANENVKAYAKASLRSTGLLKE